MPRTAPCSRAASPPAATELPCAEGRFAVEGQNVPRYFFFLLRRGTLPPARRACERPMAIACLRLFTRLRERPLRNVPRLRSRMARSTFLDAFLPYFAIEIPFEDTCGEDVTRSATCVPDRNESRLRD